MSERYLSLSNLNKVYLPHSNGYKFQGFIDQDDDTSKSLSPPGIGNGGDLGVNSVTGSLEDLVATFDEKLQQCFKDYEEEAEKIAPVQVK